MKNGTILFLLILASGIPIYVRYYKRKIPFTPNRLGDDFMLATLSVFLISGLIGALIMKIISASIKNDLVETQAAMISFVCSLAFLFWIANWHANKSRK